MSVIVLILLIIICLFTIYIFYKLFDKRGLFFANTILSILTFILSFKIGYIFKMNINLGIIPFISVLTINYIYLIKYDKKNINSLLLTTTITNAIMVLFLVIINYYIPAITETISINMQGTFETNYKIIILYPIIMTLSEYIVIKLYTFISNLQNNNILSLLLTYIITALIYTIIYYLLVYINILSIKDSLYLGITTYIIGLVIHIINIIFIYYLTKSKKVKKWETYY